MGSSKLVLPKWAKSVTVITTSLMTLTAGTLYGFSSYSADLVTALGHDGNLDILGSFGDAGIYAGITMGLLTDKFGPIATLIVSAVLAFAGYFTVWLAVSKTLVVDVPVLAVAFFLAGQGSFGFYFTSVYLNGKLVGPDHRAAVYGYVLMLFGFSSLVYLSIYTELLHKHIDEFFLVLAVSLPSAGLLTAFGQFMIHACGTAPEAKTSSLYNNGSSGFEAPDSSGFHRPEDEIILPTSIEADIDVGRPLMPPQHATRSLTGLQLLRSVLFWILFVYFVCEAGPGLMWKNKVGTVIRSYETPPVDTDTVVKSWSIINSLSRVCFGALADTLARWNIPKSVLLIFAGVVMGASHLFYSLTAYTEDQQLASVALWITNVATAMAYGCQFTVVTSLTAQYFGAEGLGMNLGAVSIAPGVGGTALTAIVNSLPDNHSATGFLCSAISVGIALVCAILLVRNDILESRQNAFDDL